MFLSPLSHTVDQLEKQRAEAQEEVDDLINALRRERDLGDEEIIFLKAQLRGITATKYENEDKVETLEKVGTYRLCLLERSVSKSQMSLLHF